MAVAENNGVVSSDQQQQQQHEAQRSNGGTGDINGTVVAKDQSYGAAVKMNGNGNGVAHADNGNGVVVVEEEEEREKSEDDVKDDISDENNSDDCYDDKNVVSENGKYHGNKEKENVIFNKSNVNVDDVDVGVEEKGDVKVKVKEENFDDIDKKKKDEGFKKEIRDLEEMLSKLNPMAKEFVPPSISNFRGGRVNNFGYVNNGFVIQQPNVVPPVANVGANVNGFPGRRRRNGYGQGKRRMNARTSMAQREDVIRRTVYVSDIDQQVTEEQLAGLFITCGQVVDCRVCGDPNSVLRFAFIEFTDEEGAKNALTLSGTMLGFYPVRVLPSKTAIAPVNPTFLPKSEDEREMCARTVYCTNIDKKVTQADIKLFFETFCGEVHRLRLLGDYHHSTRIAFVEFIMAESAISALNCSGAVLGTLPIRVSPSKTPVRPKPPRSPVH